MPPKKKPRLVMFCRDCMCVTEHIDFRHLPVEAKCIECGCYNKFPKGALAMPPNRSVTKKPKAVPYSVENDVVIGPRGEEIYLPCYESTLAKMLNTAYAAGKRSRSRGRGK